MESQYDLQQEILKKTGINIVTCGNCGITILHRKNDTTITCPDCGFTDEPSSFPDLNYETDIIKQEKINYIKKIISSFGEFRVSEVDGEESPSANSMGNNTVELIEGINTDGVDTIIYNDEIEIDTGFIEYEDLDKDAIDSVVYLAEQYEAQRLRDEKRISD